MSDSDADQPPRPQSPADWARRVGAWLAWWGLAMSLWLLIDFSIALPELLVGAGVAAMTAVLAELAGYQTRTRLRMRIEWVVPALRLPQQVARDTLIVFAALWRQLVHGTAAPSGYRELPMTHGGDDPESVTRRVLAIGGKSVAPNAFVLGIDPDRDVMVIHQLVVNEGRATPRRKAGGRR